MSCDATAAQAGGGHQVSDYHAYTDAGIYVVTVTVTDLAGESDGATSLYVVVYDPNGGFATGGGWFIPGGGSSDPGDILPGLDGSSKAKFGFVVKYQNGASTTPGGNLTFHYDIGNFELKSADMDWLVVTNSNWAKFQGGATINGSDDIYPFRVDARDSNNGTDRFVIKVYAPAADPNADDPIYKASGDLGVGDIKIHD